MMSHRTPPSDVCAHISLFVSSTPHLVARWRQLFVRFVALPLTHAFHGYQKTWNADLQLRPFLLGGVFKACGNVPPATVRAKGINMTHDLRRINECCAIPVQAPKVRVSEAKNV